MTEIDGLNMRTVDTPTHTKYEIADKHISLDTVVGFVQSAEPYVDVEELYYWITEMEEDAVVTNPSGKKELIGITLQEEIEEAMEYIGVDISDFS